MTIDTSDAARDFAARYGLSRDELLARRNTKWHRYAPDVIPAFVADMDFRVAEPIDAAIRESVDSSDYGYAERNGLNMNAALEKAFSARMNAKFGWNPDPALNAGLADLVQASFASVFAFSEPGDGVIVQVPNYPPFRRAVEEPGRRFVPMPMVDTGTSWGIDLDAMEAQMTPDISMMILCNPQNPTGHAFTRAELEALLAFAERHNLIIVSDEIHCDLVYPGATHIPFASLNAEAAARTITLNSATKGFNIAGLRTAVMSFGTQALKQRFVERLPLKILGSVSSIGADATIAAWEQGDEWLAGLLAHLQAMRDHMAARLEAEIPAIRFHKSASTYLNWLDCSELELKGTAFDFFHERGKIAFSAGENFLPGSEKFIRFNFATTQPIIDQIVDRMVEAVKGNVR